MDHFIVECSYGEPVSEEQDRAAGRAIDAYLAGHGGRWVRSFYNKERTRMICEFEAGSEADVRAAWQAAGSPDVEVWPATVYEAETAGSVSGLS